MIGMNQIKRKLVSGIFIGLAVGLVGVIVTIVISNSIVKSYEQGTNKKFLSNYTTDVVVFTKDVVQGEKITDDMLTTATIHNMTVPTGAITSTGSIVGKIAKYNIMRNSTAVDDMVADKIVLSDVREQEINTIVLPTDLAVNDFVDIRIMYPSGVEYIVLTKKQVKKIVGSTVWIDMGEADTLMLNSAVVDSYLVEGSKLYAVRYADPTTQVKLDEEGVAASAKLYIRNELGKKLSTIKDINEVYTNEVVTVQTSEVDENGDPVVVAINTVKATEKMAEILADYAIEYRYYIESYNGDVQANYQPNSQVMAFMKTHPNVVDQAKQKLSETSRKYIENSIASFESSSGDAYYNVISGISNSVSAQQSLRNEVLGAAEVEE